MKHTETFTNCEGEIGNSNFRGQRPYKNRLQKAQIGTISVKWTQESYHQPKFSTSQLLHDPVIGLKSD
jgi:hypothetical protein